MENKSIPDPPSLAVLSPSILKTFTTLSGGPKQLFKTLFYALWRYLWPISRIDGVLHCYLLPLTLDQAPGNLTVYQWFLLCRLFMLTGGGSTPIDSRSVQFTKHEQNMIPGLIRTGLILRTSFDPAMVRYSSHRSIQKVFISFTPSGLAFIRGVLTGLNKALRNDLCSVQPLSK